MSLAWPRIASRSPSPARRDHRTGSPRAAGPGARFDSLLAIRFLAGLPHGAYFGGASVVAGNLVAPERRSSAMAVVFAGLTVANVIGVPLTTLIGQHTSWRLVFALVGRSATSRR